MPASPYVISLDDAARAEQEPGSPEDDDGTHPAAEAS